MDFCRLNTLSNRRIYSNFHAQGLKVEGAGATVSSFPITIELPGMLPIMLHHKAAFSVMPNMNNGCQTKQHFKIIDMAWIFGGCYKAVLLLWAYSPGPANAHSLITHLCLKLYLNLLLLLFAEIWFNFLQRIFSFCLSGVFFLSYYPLRRY